MAREQCFTQPLPSLKVRIYPAVLRAYLTEIEAEEVALELEYLHSPEPDPSAYGTIGNPWTLPTKRYIRRRTL
jgi:hypothetical protein